VCSTLLLVKIITELYEEFRRNLKIQKDLLSLKRLVYVLIILVVIISLATLGTSFAAAILAKDTTTSNGVLIVKGDGETVATQSNAETYQVVATSPEEQRRRRAQVIDGQGFQDLTVGLVTSDTISLADAIAIEDKCDLGRTVYLLRECPDGRRNHILICGQGAPGFESGDALEFTDPTYRFKYANDKVVMLCPKSGSTCSVSVDTTYAPPCSANIPTMTDESIRTAAYIFRYNRNEFSTLYGAINDWDVSTVTDMSTLFASVDGNFCISSWDVSNVVNMKFMFDYARDFECDLGAWNVSSVTDMQGIFRDAHSFTGQGLENWDVSSVTIMRSMFDTAKVFNADISSWDVSSVTDTGSMFYGAAAFSQNLCPWGTKLAPVATVMSMFKQTACANLSDPDFTATPAGPFCSVCV